MRFSGPRSRPGIISFLTNASLRRGVTAARGPHEPEETVRFGPTQSRSFHRGHSTGSPSFPVRMPAHHGHPGSVDAVGEEAELVSLYQAWNHPARVLDPLFASSLANMEASEFNDARTPCLHFFEVSTLIKEREVKPCHG